MEGIQKKEQDEYERDYQEKEDVMKEISGWMGNIASSEPTPAEARYCTLRQLEFFSELADSLRYVKDEQLELIEMIIGNNSAELDPTEYKGKVLTLLRKILEEEL